MFHVRSEIRIGKVGAQGMTQSVGCLLCEQEAPSLDASTVGKSSAVKREFDEEIELPQEAQL